MQLFVFFGPGALTNLLGDLHNRAWKYLLSEFSTGLWAKLLFCNRFSLFPTISALLVLWPPCLLLQVSKNARDGVVSVLE